MNPVVCPYCGSTEIQSRGTTRIYCKNCKRYPTISDHTDYQMVENYANHTSEVSASVPRILSDEELLEFLNIDRDTWRITKVIYGKSEAYRKDRQVEWDVEDGEVKHGKVRDSGKLLVQPLFSVKVFLERKTQEIRWSQALEDSLEAIRKASKPSKKLPKHDGHYLYEIAMPDLQLGRLTTLEGSGVDQDVQATADRAMAAMQSLMHSVDGKPIDRVLFPVGNDFFDSNTAEMTTAHGTPQQDDVRWQRTFRTGRDLLVQTIDMWADICPVDVLVIHGNHDEERIFYMGELLDAWYHNNPNVQVDHSESKRKYYAYHNNLIGFTHGYYEKNERLAALMAFEVPEMWAKSKNREWHLGDKHHKKDMIFKTDELENGVVVRVLRSLATPSVWEYDKGYVGSLKAAEGFLWDPQLGVVAQMTAVV